MAYLNFPRVLKAARSKPAYFAGIIIALLLALSSMAHAGPEEDAYPFSQGAARLTLLFGRGEAFGNTYSIYGLGAGYFVRDGIEAGLSVEQWTGADPGITRVSPEARFVFYRPQVFKPYLGAFFRRAFVDRGREINEVGARAGVNVMVGQRAYVAAGAVYRKTLHCLNARTSTCTDTYPEFLVAVVF